MTYYLVKRRDTEQYETEELGDGEWGSRRAADPMDLEDARDSVRWFKEKSIPAYVVRVVPKAKATTVYEETWEKDRQFDGDILVPTSEPGRRRVVSFPTKKQALIASAAPEMLRALEALMQHNEGRGGQLAVAAIMKARGE